MFNGIVRSVGTILSVVKAPGGCVCEIRTNLARTYRPGESILLSGICTTVVKAKKGSATFFLMDETLEKTSARDWKKGTRINIEPALRAGQDMSGHIVTGHVDGIGYVKEIKTIGDMTRVRVSVPSILSRYLVPKGSIAIDGVSLTVVDVNRSHFSVALIPFTKTHSTLGALKEGKSINIEVDVLAKYVERLVYNTRKQ